MKTKKIIEEIVSLPVEERALVVDSLLRSLNSPEPRIDVEWAKESARRLEELRSGKVRSIPGDEVFSRVFDRLEK